MRSIFALPCLALPCLALPCLALLIVNLTSCLSQNDGKPATKTDQRSVLIMPELIPPQLAKAAPDASWLFVMKASKASLIKTAKGYNLALKNIDPKVLLFSDRPQRAAGFITAEDFITVWIHPNSTFNSDPPNAAMVFDELADGKNRGESVAVELRYPIKSGPDEWTFQLQDLAGKLSAGEITELSLFIDSWHWSDIGPGLKNVFSGNTNTNCYVGCGTICGRGACSCSGSNTCQDNYGINTCQPADMQSC